MRKKVNFSMMHLLLISLIFLRPARDPLGKDISGNGGIFEINTPSRKALIIEAVNEKNEPVEGIPVVLVFPDGKVFPDTAITDARGYAVFHIQPEKEGKNEIAAISPLAENEVKLLIYGFKRFWLFFMISGVLGGLALFMFGLHYGGKALTRVGGNKLREFLWKFTRIPVLGVLTGIFITIMTQSSSATTVMLVSFTDAGIMKFWETLGVILGADIGTTLTVQLVAFKIHEFSLFMIFTGFILMLFPGKRWKLAGRVIFSFGLVFFGMKIMSDAVAPLKEIKKFHSLLAWAGKRPLIGILAAAVFTGIIQSSGATMALILSLSFQNLITLKEAIPLIFGANIGTCVTAVIASVGRDVEAKKVALAHVLFKVLGVILFFPFLSHFAHFISLLSPSLSRSIANAHTFFNVGATLLFLPFLRPFSALVRFLTPAEKKKKEFGPLYIDPTFLGTPPIAMGAAMREVLRMADMVLEMYRQSIKVLEENDVELRERIIKEDDKVDLLDEKITLYLTRLSEEELSPELSKRSVILLEAVDELESIGDVVSKNLMTYARKKIEKGFMFSKEGFSEIKRFHGWVMDTIVMAVDALATFEKELAEEVVKRREEGVEYLEKLEASHIQRLRKGYRESIETSAVHLDLISDLERINFHATGIAKAILMHG